MLIGAALLLSACGDGSVSSGEAYRACEDAVESQLRSPGSADFSGALGSDVTETEGGGYSIRGTVDSDNAFGASLRSNFSCEIGADGGVVTVNVG